MVDADDLACGLVALGQLTEQSACSGGDIQDPLTALHVGQLERDAQSITLERD